MARLALLKDRDFRNPAVFALEYTSLPDLTWPEQFKEKEAGFNYLRAYLGNSSRICSGDSARATLVLSHLLDNGAVGEEPVVDAQEKPGLAVLLSPWMLFVSGKLNQNTASDYLAAESLHLYGREYSGKAPVSDCMVSPGQEPAGRWAVAAPTKDFAIIYGAEDVLAPGIEATIDRMETDGVTNIAVHKEEAGIHVWPVVNLFLASTRDNRPKGLNIMTDVVFDRRGGPAGRLEDEATKKEH